MASASAHVGGPVALSFSSSGLLFPYHMGAIETILNHSPPLTISEVHGVSGGSLAGAVALLGKASLEKVRSALEVRIHPTWGELWDPSLLLPRLARQYDILTPDAFSTLSGKLSVYTTVGGMLRNTKQHVNSEFNDNEELLTWLQASCSFAFEGVEINGVPHWDGGCCGCWMARSGALPTIAVSPVWTEDAQICPQPASFGMDVKGFRMDWPSIRAGWDCCFMFSPERMKWYWQQGQADAKVFLKDHFKGAAPCMQASS